mgnify:FL=1
MSRKQKKDVTFLWRGKKGNSKSKEKNNWFTNSSNQSSRAQENIKARSQFSAMIINSQILILSYQHKQYISPHESYNLKI